MANNIQIVSFNSRGLGDKRKRLAVFQYIKTHHNGIVFLQETHTNKQSESLWKKEWHRGQIFFSHAASNKRGVAILFPKKLPVVINDTVHDNDGRYLLLDVSIDGKNIILLNIYAPTKDYPKEQLLFINSLNSLLENYVDRQLIISGDFNICLNPDIDKCGGRHEKQTEYTQSLLELMDNYNLNDIWRVKNSDSK
jgi:exonuclease III